MADDRVNLYHLLRAQANAQSLFGVLAAGCARLCNVLCLVANIFNLDKIENQRTVAFDRSPSPYSVIQKLLHNEEAIWRV